MDLEAIRKAAREGSIEPKREEPKPKAADGDVITEGRAVDANAVRIAMTEQMTEQFKKFDDHISTANVKAFGIPAGIIMTGMTTAEAVKAMKGLAGSGVASIPKGATVTTHTHAAPTGPMGPPKPEASSDPIGRLPATWAIVVWLWGRSKRLIASYKIVIK